MRLCSVAGKLVVDLRLRGTVLQPVELDEGASRYPEGRAGRMNLFRLLAELRRRRVFRVAAVYAVAAWGLLQVSTTVAPLLRLPEWAPRLVLLLLLMGFPVALVLAWAYDITPDGVKRSLAEPLRDEAGAAEPLVAPAHAGAGGHPMAYLAVGILVALAGFAAYATFEHDSRPREARAAPVSAGITSVAVLRFADLSDSKANEYFSAGMSEEILDALAQLPGLRVAGRTSSFAVSDKGFTLREVARQLNVATVLDGSVRREGSRVRVSAQLVDAATGYQIWTEEYERSVNDMLQLQEEIARAIVAALRLRLDAGRVHVAESTTPEAHDLYLRGVYELNKRGLALNRAIDYFRRAIALDSTYAPAWAGLALAYDVRPIWIAAVRPEDGLSQGYEAARRALARDSTLAEAHTAAALPLAYLRCDYAGAEREFRRAIELNPSYTTAHQWYGELLSYLGRSDQAASEGEEALSLDPFSPSTYLDLARTYVVAGRPEKSEATLRRGLEIAPDVSYFRVFLAGTVLPAEGKLGEALALAESLPLASDNYALAYVLAARGRRDEARHLLPKAEAEASPVNVAGIFLALGERDSAFAWLERWAARPATDTESPFGPALAPLRGDPRFAAILRKRRIRH